MNKKIDTKLPKSYTEVIAEMVQKRIDARKEEEERLLEELKDSTKGKRVIIKGSLSNMKLA